jgi:hypothetical protein
MTDEPLYLVDPEDPAESDEPVTVPTGILTCAECTILIGSGYLERVPFPHPQGHGVVCRACLESLERRALRGDAAKAQDPPRRDPRQHW